jgi:hypothetical protein
MPTPDLFGIGLVSVSQFTVAVYVLWRSGMGVFRRRSLIENGARYRVRTCDPFRVKEVLYH